MLWFRVDFGPSRTVHLSSRAPHQEPRIDRFRTPPIRSEIRTPDQRATGQKMAQRTTRDRDPRSYAGRQQRRLDIPRDSAATTAGEEPETGTTPDEERTTMARAT